MRKTLVLLTLAAPAAAFLQGGTLSRAGVLCSGVQSLRRANLRLHGGFSMASLHLDSCFAPHCRPSSPVIFSQQLVIQEAPFMELWLLHPAEQTKAPAN
jgi:hypothetical protein